MKNQRNAGRKAKITENQMEMILQKIAQGDSVAKVAEEFGISKQGLYKKIHLHDQIDYLNLNYIMGNEIITQIAVNIKEEIINIKNVNYGMSKRPFGINNNPDWNDFTELIQKEYFFALGGDEDISWFVLNEEGCMTISFELLLSSPKSHLRIADASSEISGNYYSLIRPYGGDKKSELSEENSFYEAGPINRVAIKQYLKKRELPEIVIDASDKIIHAVCTTGYHIKGISLDRKRFIKCQAILQGTVMDDWAVELIAMDLCRQLSIPYMEQHKCQIVFDNKVYWGICSENMQADGCEFIPLTRLIQNIGYTEEGFEYFNAINKIKWCADKLSLAGSIEYSKTLKYMIDMVLIDCLVGNSDRKLDNIGLIYNMNKGEYEIAPVFNCGLGLFEHDEYRDTYLSYESAILTVSILPYDETPFDLLSILNEEFDLTGVYPALKNIIYDDRYLKPYSRQYVVNIKKQLENFYN